jgi:serine/threonine-protein kinase
VYRARDLALGRDVALKIIAHGELAPFDRFRQEALALSRLKSRHIARVHDFGRDEELGYYLAMEHIDGVPLEVGALGRSLLSHEVLRAARGLLSALGEAHIAGIVHRDIKPSNVLVPGALAGLHDVRLLDFGIARSERRAQVREGMGELDTREGVVVGTPAYLAPELVAGGRATPATDVYAAGLVLFDLLGKGPLFPGETWSDQLGGRLRDDPVFEGRVDEPLARLFCRMLARDPDARFSRADEAVSFISDLETAPVVAEELLRDAKRKSSPPMSTTLQAAAALGGTARRPSQPPPRPSSPPTAPASTRPPQSPTARPTGRGEGSPASMRPATGLYGTRRLARLEAQPHAALLECLHALDLAMLDALARREEKGPWGAIVSAIASALRLDLRRAAEILSGSNTPEARAVAATLVAPRASRAVATELDAGDDAWIDRVAPELAAVLSALGLALATQEAACRQRERCRRVVARLDTDHDEPGAWGALPDVSGVVASGARRSTMKTTLAMADWCARALAGEVPRSIARDECLKLRDIDALPVSPLQTFTRALLVAFATANADQHVTREQLERASKVAVESGATLLEVRAMVSWGGLLLEIPGRVDQGMGVLDRAAALLDGADAPSLQYIAEHNRAAALLIQGRYAEAAPYTRRARQAAAGELSLDHEILSATNEIHALLALGDRAGADELLATIAEDRAAATRARTRMHVRCTRSLAALPAGDLPRARVELRLHGDERLDIEASSDGYLLAESLAIVYAWAGGEQASFLARAAELEKVAHDRGHTSFYFLRMVDAIVAHIGDLALRARLHEALSRLSLLLDPEAERGPDSRA